MIAQSVSENEWGVHESESPGKGWRGGWNRLYRSGTVAVAGATPAGGADRGHLPFRSGTGGPCPVPQSVGAAGSGVLPAHSGKPATV